MTSQRIEQEKERIFKDYDKKGYVIIDNFLPKEAADSLLAQYGEAMWDEINQVRDHYKHVFSTKNPLLPQANELYKAKFDRSQDLERSEIVQTIFHQHFVPALNDVTRTKLSEFDVRCYQLKPGQYYRTHIDDYAGEVGVIYYLNPAWCWDWGGILHVLGIDDQNPEKIDSIYPKFNRLILLNHKRFRFPHFISTVSEFALKPRYTLIAFCK